MFKLLIFLLITSCGKEKVNTRTDYIKGIKKGITSFGVVVSSKDHSHYVLEFNLKKDKTLTHSHCFKSIELSLDEGVDIDYNFRVQFLGISGYWHYCSVAYYRGSLILTQEAITVLLEE